MEGSGIRTDDRQKCRQAQEVRPQDQLRRGGGIRQDSSRAAESDGAGTQETVAVQANRAQGHWAQRRPLEGEWLGEIRHRRAGSGHDLRVRAAVTAGRRQAEGR